MKTVFFTANIKFLADKHQAILVNLSVFSILSILVCLICGGVKPVYFVYPTIMAFFSSLSFAVGSSISTKNENFNL